MARPHGPKLAPGEIFAQRYRIEGVAGHGGFAAIYEATHLESGHRVALKVLLTNFSTRQVDSKRFGREAALVQKLRHENVVQLLDFGQTERGVPFIAFELLRGQSLDALLEGGSRLTVERTATIARDVLCALNAAHLLGIVHRDIKPGNVFLCEGNGGPGPTKVLDFGIAKALHGEESKQTELTKDGQMIGTPYYMAPEQVRGSAVGPQTDLYALGLVMCEMLTAERLVGAPSVLGVYMAQIAEAPLELPPAVAATPLGPIIARAIEKPLDRRYRSAREMLEGVDAVLLALGGASASKRPATDTAETAVMRDRRPGHAAAAGVAARPAPGAAARAVAARTQPLVAQPMPSENLLDDLLERTVDDDDPESAKATAAFMGFGQSQPQPHPPPAPQPPESSGHPAGAPVSKLGTTIMPATDPSAAAARAAPASGPPAAAPASVATGQPPSAAQPPQPPGSTPAPGSGPPPAAAPPVPSWHAVPGASSTPAPASPRRVPARTVAASPAHLMSVPAPQPAAAPVVMPQPPQAARRNKGSGRLWLAVVIVVLGLGVVAGLVAFHLGYLG